MVTLPPQHRRRAERIAELAEKGKKIANLDVKHPGYGNWIEDKASLNEWLIQVENIIETTFGENSPHVNRLRKKLSSGVTNSNSVNAVRGLLLGGLSDLRGGYLAQQEFLIAGEIFDSVLDRASHLLETGYKDAAAVLSRVVLEDSLKRLARQEEVEPDNKASWLNDTLKKEGRYGQPLWRQIQVWLDIGNSAAHGDFDAYDSSAVENMISGIESFLAVELRAT